jgi:hypothetical protein
VGIFAGIIPLFPIDCTCAGLPARATCYRRVHRNFHKCRSQDEIAELLEFAMEGRRRVKEQLKKMGSFEYYHTSFSYTLNDTGEERFVGVPEQAAAT